MVKRCTVIYLIQRHTHRIGTHRMDSDNVYATPDSTLKQDTITPELASRSDRFIAVFIDLLANLAVSLPFLYLTGYLEKARAGLVGPADVVTLFVFSLVVYAALHGYLLSKYGQTIGKRLLGIQIVDVNTNQIVSFAKVFTMRYLPTNVAIQVPVIGQLLLLIDALMIFRKNRRTLHDMIAGTKVVELKK
ncbi:RDD family protein [Leucothrix sargassi]|nr:RDD family protein [Leucothrix sargassi]